MEEKICLNFNGKKFSVNAKVCSELEKVTGLMFTKREKAEILLFSFNKPSRIRLHSWFVFFPFIVLWTDDKNRILDIKIVRPFEFSILPKKSFYKIIEIPMNKNHEGIIKFLVGRKV